MKQFKPKNTNLYFANGDIFGCAAVAVVAPPVATDPPLSFDSAISICLKNVLLQKYYYYALFLLKNANLTRNYDGEVCFPEKRTEICFYRSRTGRY